MKPEHPGNEALRRAFAAAPGAAPGPECPPPADVWAASRGELPAARAEELLAHSATCPACADSWRFAAAMTGDAGEVMAAPERSQRPRLRTGLALAALAASLAVVGLLLPWRRPADQTREVPGFSITSRLDAERALTRDDCILSWSPGPEGTLYTVEVARTDLSVIARAPQIETSHYKVPASALARLPPGSALLWRVEAVLPDATRISSPVFRATLE